MSVLAKQYSSDTTDILAGGNLLILVAHDVPTPADLRALRHEGLGLGRKCPNGIHMMLCVRPGVATPKEEVRGAMIDALRAISPHFLCFCAVIQGRGFGASAKRSVFAALSLALTGSYPTKVFSEVSAGVSWIGGQVQDASLSQSQLFLIGDELSRLAGTGSD